MTLDHNESWDAAWNKFAAAALQALLTREMDWFAGSVEADTAKSAAAFADAMMKEWEKR